MDGDPGCWLLAWLTGRDAGTMLSASAASGAGQEPADARRLLPP
jgi:hypothetical protein